MVEGGFCKTGLVFWGLTRSENVPLLTGPANFSGRIGDFRYILNGTNEGFFFGSGKVVGEKGDFGQ